VGSATDEWCQSAPSCLDVDTVCPSGRFVDYCIVMMCHVLPSCRPCKSSTWRETPASRSRTWWDLFVFDREVGPGRALVCVQRQLTKILVTPERLYAFCLGGAHISRG
jgi:hypothetical protein